MLYTTYNIETTTRIHLDVWPGLPPIEVSSQVWIIYGPYVYINLLLQIMKYFSNTTKFSMAGNNM